MAIERTLSIIKPDAVRMNQAEAICQYLNDKGFKVKAARYHHLTREEAEQFYADHYGKEFFEDFIQFMISGQVLVQILERDHAITLYRQAMGATDPKKAAPGTLRAEFGGKALPANAVHGSDNPINAEREMSFFFKDVASIL